MARRSFGVGIVVGLLITSPAPLMISSYVTGALFISFSSLLEEEECRERLAAIRIAFFSASSGSLDSLPFSCSAGGIARFSFEDEALELLRGVTTPAV